MNTSMNPRLLLQLCEIVECGSLRLAAQRLNTTQPTLSRNIQILEDRVGSPVLRRLRHGVEPTRLGQRLVQRGQEILSQCALAELTVEQWNMGMEEEIVLGIGPVLAASIMPAFFEGLLEQKLPYTVRVLTLPPDQLVYRVHDGELDAAIAPAALKRRYTDMHRTPLFRDQAAIFAGPNHPLSARADTLKPEDLKDETWINVGPPVSRSIVRDAMRAGGLEHLHTAFDFYGDIMLGLNLVLRTNVLATMPRFQIRRVPGGADLTELPMPFDVPKQGYAMWTKEGDSDRPVFLDFKARLSEYLDALPDLDRGTE